MRIGSACSGYGGLELGLQSVIGGEVAWHVENDPHASRILAHHWPAVPNHGDLTTVDWTQVEPVDWLTAGWPCQPFSDAGKRRGTDDERHLWPFVARAISVLRPRYFLGENVRGHLTLGFDSVLCDLARLGYDATWGVVRAADAGAPHGRARIFVIAHAPSDQGWISDRDHLSAVNTRLCAGGSEHGEQSAFASIRARQSGEGAAAVAECPGLQGQPKRRLGRAGEFAEGGQGAAPDAECQRRDGRTPEPLRRPTTRTATAGDRQDAASDTDGPGRGRVTELNAPSAARLDSEYRRHPDRRGDGTDWGAYTSAIRRWEHVTGRPAPRPTEPGRTGQRLAPTFVEWLMGLPEGHVTAVGLPRNAQLKALGNGVVPQQCALAVRTLLPLSAIGVAA